MKFERTPSARPASAAFLTLKYGSALDQIKQVFFALEDPRKENVLNGFGQRFGLAASLHARRYYRRWKSGDLALSGPTLLRLLELLPDFMLEEEKLELLKRLHQETLKRSCRRTVRVELERPSQIPYVLARIGELSYKPQSKHIASSFGELSPWLQGENLHGLESLAIEFEHEMVRERLVDLTARLVSLSPLRKIDRKKLRLKVNLEFRTTNVSVNITLPRSYWKKMESDDDLLVRLQELALKQEQQGGGLSYVDYVMRTLTPEEQTKLRAIAAAEGLKTEILLKELQVKTLAARGDIQSVIETAEELKAKKHKSKISSEHATASGVTKIEIENRRGWGCGSVLAGVTGLFAVIVAIVTSWPMH